MGTPAVSNAIPKEKAIEEINKWLDHKNIRKKKRESNQESIDELVEAIEDGALVFDEETKDLIMQLLIPIGTKEDIKELRFKSRLKVGEVHQHLKKVKTGDNDGRLLAYVQALTGKPAAMIEDMDTGDQQLAVTIVIFFL